MKSKNSKQAIQTCELYVDGMHCAACEVLIEKKLSKVKGIQSVDAQLSNGTVKVKGTLDTSPEELAQQLTQIVKKDGYTIQAKKSGPHSINWSEMLIGFVIALVVMGGFLWLQKAGVLELQFEKINYPAVFLIGFVASLSSCAAVVGGLVLSLSANYAKETEEKQSLYSRIKPQALFHISRILGFFLLGGVIGLIGAAFTLTRGMTFGLSVLVGLVMIVLGINLLDVFPFIRKLQPNMPKFIGHKVFKAQEIQSKYAPIILGIVTFFLPCGFTQSMQLYALSTGSFWTGALTMLVFALGTFPVLAVISFASTNLSQSKWSGVFFKTSGFIVLTFALINIINAMVVMGWIEPVFNF